MFTEQLTSVASHLEARKVRWKRVAEDLIAFFQVSVALFNVSVVGLFEGRVDRSYLPETDVKELFIDLLG